MKLWTIQPEEIGKLLENGESFICNVNKSQFYNEKCFHNAYDWMISKMNEKNISNPKHIKLPIWAWYRRNNKCKKPDLRESGFAKRGDKCVLIELEIPDNDVLLSDFDLWHNVLNNFPIFNIDENLVDEEFDKEFDIQYDKYMNMKINEKECFKKNSWNEIFHIENSKYVQAVFWELKIEYIKSLRYFIAK